MFKNITKVIKTLEIKNEILKKELRFSNARIVESAIEIEALKVELEDTKGEATYFHRKNRELRKETKELQAKLVKQYGLPFVEEVKEALEEEKAPISLNPLGLDFSLPKDIQDEVDLALKTLKEQKAFSSQFMPNVKFCIMGDKRNLLKPLGFACDSNYMRTDNFGHLVDKCDYQGKFDDEWMENEVSIYEAIPELVPKGMVYDKVADELVKKVCVNQMCAGEYCACDGSHSFKNTIDPEKEKLSDSTNKAKGLKRKLYPEESVSLMYINHSNGLSGSIIGQFTTCPYCKGSGKLVNIFRTSACLNYCEHCDGLGMVKKT